MLALAMSKLACLDLLDELALGSVRSAVMWEAEEHGFDNVSPLTVFGLFAVTAMLVSYALEKRSHWFILAFAGSCALGSAYGFLQGAWPFGLVEAVWSIVALQRWRLAKRST